MDLISLFSSFYAIKKKRYLTSFIFIPIITLNLIILSFHNIKIIKFNVRMRKFIKRYENMALHLIFSKKKKKKILVRLKIKKL